ncbi:MAG TPA: septation protein SpoVG family protein [Coleofasciculaceae cyanobacterium]|jgi:DNA-binding cell septation regulator SpoVG
MTQFAGIVVTEVHVTLIRPSGGLIAMARVVLNDALVLDGIGIHTKLSGGYRLTYPTRNLPSGGRKTMFHPIKTALSKAIEEAIFQKVANIQKDVDRNDRHYPPDIG